MNFNVREAKMEDYDRINCLAKEVHSLHIINRPDIYQDADKPIDYNYFEILIDNSNAKIYLLENDVDKDLIGYIILEEIETHRRSILRERKIVFINDLCVKEEYKGMGIGRLLFEKAVSYGREIGVDSLELGVWEFNEDAIKFYESMGMSTKDRRMEIKI